ncbi:MAG TPA: hypothetical protein DCG34_02255 [Clostridiales bacterium]|jgi:hypothetical protein|nr:hypothetical protein [Clostridiales bacterium]
MLALPDSTIFGRSIPKEKLFTNLGFEASMRANYNRRITSILWQHKLAPETLHIAKGNTVFEIQVFEVRIRDVKDFDYRILECIDQRMPQYILFVLTCKGWTQLVLNYKEKSSQTLQEFKVITSFKTKWMEEGTAFTLDLHALDMDALYASIIGQLSEGEVGATQFNGNLSKAIDVALEIRSLAKQIGSLEKRMNREVQVNKKLEYRRQLLPMKDRMTKLVQERY